jgi:hypothetical protein
MSSSDTLRPVRDALLCETQEDMDRLDAHHNPYSSRALAHFTGRCRCRRHPFQISHTLIMERRCHAWDEKAVSERLNRRALRCACAGAAREYSAPRSLSRYPAEELARMLARTFNAAFAERLVDVVDTEARRLVDRHGGPLPRGEGEGEGERPGGNERLARLRRVCCCWLAVGDDGPSRVLYI